jgi:CheY-like chemotaxis protein/anti-sigma regulatory factor (Ser/Thr protein kinase)
METALQLVQGELRHRARIVREYAPGVPQVQADESRLTQVFVNLLVNAAHALPEGHADEHEVRLRAFSDGEGHVSVEVRDTGAGIPAQHLPHVFEPFFTTKAPGRGTGLGLSVCKGLIDGYGGTLSLASTEGGGTTATVTLPAARATKPDTVRPGVEPVPLEIETKSILVVDDDPLVRRSLERMLRAHIVSMAGSGRDALDVMQRQHFDLVFCDLMMPELTGMDLFAELAARGDGLERKLVFMTGGAFTDRARRFVDTVPNTCLEKPFNPAKIREIVANAPRLLPMVKGSEPAQPLPSVCEM